jgi:hypothetical protein
MVLSSYPENKGVDIAEIVDSNSNIQSQKNLLRLSQLFDKISIFVSAR